MEDELDGNVTLELETTSDELEDFTTEDESRTEELDCNVALELKTTGDELEDFTTEEESGAEELDCNVTLELETTDDELSSSDTELLFPLSPSQATKINATATIPNKVIRCFRFISFLLLTLNYSKPYKNHNSENSTFNEHL